MKMNCGLSLRALTLGLALVKICVPLLVSVTRVKRLSLANNLTEKVRLRARGSRVYLRWNFLGMFLNLLTMRCPTSGPSWTVPWASLLMTLLGPLSVPLKGPVRTRCGAVRPMSCCIPRSMCLSTAWPRLGRSVGLDGAWRDTRVTSLT